MPYVNVPSLAGGISQQPPHLRAEGQVADSQNLLYSTAEGARKRHGTKILCEVAAADSNGFSPNLSGTAYRLHAVDREDGESYLVIYGDSTLRIYNDDGTEATLTMDSDAEAYLDSGSADEDQIRLRSYGDTTFLINTTVSMATVSAPIYETVYTGENATAVFSYTPSASEYAEAEGDDDLALAGFYQYTMNGKTTLTYPAIDFSQIGNSWDTLAEWAGTANSEDGFKIAARRRALTAFTGGDYNHTTRTITKTGAFSSYTFQAGDQIYVTSWGTLTGSPTANAWFTISSSTDDTVVLSATQVNTLPTSTDTGQVSASDGDTVCRIGREVDIRLPDYSIVGTPGSFFEIARDIEQALRGAGLFNACCAFIATGAHGYFQITCPWRSSEAKLYAPTTPSSGVDLTAVGNPFNGGSAATGSGTLGANDDTTDPVTRWTRVAASGQANAAPDQTTMPLAITRTLLNNFDAAVITWDYRTHGDAVTNPIPTPISDGSKLQDIALHRNRLWYLSEDWLFSSQDGDLYNLFLADSTNQVDSDPIVINYGGAEDPVGWFVVPFRRALTIFTAAGFQYDLSAPEAFTPTSVVVTPSTRLKTLNVRPATSGNLLYCVASLEDKAALFEYYYDDISVASAVTNVSNHVPSLIPTTAKTVVAHEATGTVFVLPAVGNDVLVYKAEFDGGRKRLSAWGEITMDSTIQIIDIAVLGDRLFFFTTAAGYEHVLEYMPIGRETSTTPPYAVHLDRRDTLTGTYDSGSASTIFTLQVLALGSTYNSYVEEDGTYSIDASGWTYGPDAGPPVLTDKQVLVPGDLSGQDIVLGRFYTTSTELSRVYAADERGQRQTGALVTVIQMDVIHLDAGRYTVTSSSTNRSDRTSSFTTGTFSVEDHGHSRHILSAEPSRTTVTISDTSPMPLVLAGLQYEIDAAEMGAMP